MATAAPPLPPEDLSTVAWVASELQRSLETAHKALHRYLREAQALGQSDVDTPDTAILRGARAQLHQSVGALELVDLPIPARVLRASEAAVQRLIAKPSLVDEASVAMIERASFAVIDYLQRTLARRPISSVALFPQYREVQLLAGGDRIHPADLWGHHWRWHELPPEPGVMPRPANDAARDGLESLALALMRRPDSQNTARMSDFCAELGAGARTTLAATVWRLAAAFFDAQSSGLLDSDVYAKRMASRLLAQLRANVKSDDDVSERLAADLLFFCARADAPPGAAAPRLRAVRAAWDLGETAPSTDYQTARLGRFDPAQIAQARKRVAAAKDVWSAVAGGETRRLQGLAEAFALMSDSLAQLLPSGDQLAKALQSAAAVVQVSGEAPSTSLAMEMATAMLWLDAVIEEGELDAAGLAERTQQVARRVDAALAGGDVQPLEPWIEDLYRRVSDQQTMGSVVQELRASLTEIEKQIDQYFRDPSQREVLVPVPGQLSAMRGVLSVLDLEQASLAVVHMRDAVDALSATEVDPERAAQTGTFDRLADNLGALGFLIDMLSVQPQLARDLFSFDAAEGRLIAATGAPPRPVEFTSSAMTTAVTQPAEEAHQLAQDLAQDLALDRVPGAVQSELSHEELTQKLEDLSQKALVDDRTGLARVAIDAQLALDRAADDAERAAVRADLAQAMSHLVEPVAVPDAPPPAPIPPPASAPVAPGDTGLEDDAEMRGIFIEEAREVVATARQSLQNLAANSEDVSEITIVRRSFHTLKGSSRMVGLRDFGDAAWACEQVYNARLADNPRVDPQLADFTRDALDYLAEWVDAIEAHEPRGHQSAGLVRRGDELRGVAEPAVVVAAPPPAAPVDLSPPALPELPSVEPQAVEALLLHEPSLPTLAPAELIPAPLVETIELPTADVIELPEIVELAEAPEPAASIDLAALDAAEVLEPVAALDAVEVAHVIEVEPGVEPMVETPHEPPAPTLALTDVVPDLPNASDLDLAPLIDLGAEPFVEQAPLPMAVPEATPLHLELDLAALDEPDEGAPSAAMRLLDAPPIVEEIELDLGAFQPAAPTLPLDAAAAEPVVVGEGFDLLAAEAPAEPDAPVEADGPPLEVAEVAEPEAEVVEEEPVKVIGPLRIAIPLFNIFLNEADEQSRRLVTELAEWGVEHRLRAVPEAAVALAHSLAGNSATVGYAELSALARALEHALERGRAQPFGREGEPELFNEAAEEIRRLLHQFAAGFLKPVPEELMLRLADHEHWAAVEVLPVAQAIDEPVELPIVAAPMPMAEPGSDGDAEDDDEEPIEAADALDPDLMPIFEEEAGDLLPQLQSAMSDWHRHPDDRAAPESCLRTLHTFKGGARLAGAMRVGELAHRLESDIEHLLSGEQVSPQALDRLQHRLDRIVSSFDATRRAAHAPVVPVVAQPVVAVQAPEPERVVEAPTDVPPQSAIEPVLEPAPAAPAPEVEPSMADAVEAQTALASVVESEPEPEPGAEPEVEPTPQPEPEPEPPARIDWSRFSIEAPSAAQVPQASAGAGAVVRVRTGLLDRLVNSAGEVSIARARIESDVQQLQTSLEELTGSLERMRRELRDIEVQAESQIASRIEAAKASAQAFDPLEMDRFTRLQELTRMMAESVNDVATVQRGLQRTLQSTEDQLAAQSRLTRELQDDLLRTRMVEFESLADRLYRVVRQSAKDLGKQVRLDITGGSIEVDRGVLERMVGPFEHLLRNSVVHGVESPDARVRAGKDATGTIAIHVAHVGNEVAVEFSDDGAGLDLARIRERAVERGLLAAEAAASESELAQMIFVPGFSTAQSVTELAGRGVGMDVVRSEVNAMGGRIETRTQSGRGAGFRLVLPLTTAVTQVVMLRCGALRVAVPSTLIEVVRRDPTAVVAAAQDSGVFQIGDESLPFYWLADLLEGPAQRRLEGRTQSVVVVRSAAQRVVLHVDEVLGNQEVVVKNIGPQLSHMPGLAGVTLLPSGAVALIYNPVALAALYGEAVRAARRAPQALPEAEAPAAVEAVSAEQATAGAPLVMVVDDSLTVRRVTQRLLEREGYRVLLAKDGMDALEKLAEARPAVMLCDIEMPRMDGFELVRVLRADPERAGIPVVMITSRIAQKHRDHAASLGVEHYLGKPYPEDKLLALVAQFAAAEALS